MDWLTGIVLPLAMFVVAVLIGRHELALYHDARVLGDKLFPYTQGRFKRRMFGVALLVVTAGTLVVIELFPARTAMVASLELAVLVTEVVVLLALPLFDLWESGRNARVGEATRPAGPDPGRHTRRDRPR